MSVFQTGALGVNMETSIVFNSPVLSQSATRTTVTSHDANGDSLVFQGSFTVVDSSHISDGYITGVYYYHPGSTLYWSITGVDVSVLQVAQLQQMGDSNAIGELFLGPGTTYIGSGGTDVLTGSPGSGNTYIGGSGTETFITTSGQNTITGGSGVDTVQFGGPRSGYTIANNGDGSITVTDSLSFRNGTNHITNVGFLQFTDQTVIVANGDQANIARLYSAALGRKPDAAGLTGWEHTYQNGVSAGAKQQGVFVALAETSANFNGNQSIAAGFTQSAEFQQKYGVLDDTAFVTQLYQNILGRAPEATGLQSWLNVMHNGDANGTLFTREMVLVGIAESPENIKDDAGWLFVTG